MHEDKKMNCECDIGQNARMQLWTEGGRELFKAFFSIDTLQIAELFVEDNSIRDLRGSLNSQQQQRTKCWEF